MIWALSAEELCLESLKPPHTLCSLPYRSRFPFSTGEKQVTVSNLPPSSAQTHAFTISSTERPVCRSSHAAMNFHLWSSSINPEGSLAIMRLTLDFIQYRVQLCVSHTMKFNQFESLPSGSSVLFCFQFIRKRLQWLTKVLTLLWLCSDYVQATWVNFDFTAEELLKDVLQFLFPR